jgi:transposase-like protein
MSYTKAQFAEKHEQAIRLFQSGLGYKAVASALLLNPYTVRDWARHWRCQVKANAFVTPEDRQKAIALRAEGASLMEIVAEIKCSKRTILAWLAPKTIFSRKGNPHVRQERNPEN